MSTNNDNLEDKIEFLLTVIAASDTKINSATVANALQMKRADYASTKLRTIVQQLGNDKFRYDSGFVKLVANAETPETPAKNDHNKKRSKAEKEADNQSPVENATKKRKVRSKRENYKTKAGQDSSNDQQENA